MKIMIITFSFHKTGGIEQVTRDIFNSLNDNFKVNIISIDEKLEKYKNKYVKKLYKMFILKKKIQKDINEFNSNLVISLHPFLLDNLNLSNRKYKLICWVHGIDVFGINGLRYKSQLEQCDKIIAVSSFTKEHLINELSYNHKNINVINNCVYLDTFKFNELKYKDDNTLNIITIGRLNSSEQYKGHDLVIKSLKIANTQTNKKIIYTIIGEGNDKLRLQQLTKNEEIGNQVIFKGKVSFSELLDEYKKCDIFIMPSFFKERDDGTYTGEGFGIVYIEAGAIGRAVIGCTKGGQTDCIIDGTTGKLVEPNINDIAEKIVYFANNPNAIVEMGVNNRKLVEEKFSFEIYRRNINNLISEFNV